MISKSREELSRRKEYLKKKEELKECLDENRRIPHKLRGEAREILDEIIYNNEEEEILKYPKTFVTTSHSPSTSLKEFSKHLALIFNGRFVPRSRMNEEELSEFCNQNGVTHLIIMNEAKGSPSTICLSKYPYGKTHWFTVQNMKFTRRKQALKEKAGLVLDGFGSSLGENLKKTLRLMVPAYKNMKKFKDGDRVIGFVNRGGVIGFRHSTVERRRLVTDLAFDMNLYKVSAGTFEMEGGVEYQMSGFKNIVKYDVLAKDEEE
ncbi:IMP4 [Enterospora canceri]|uniref:U3 small nucleolar ribonucleoprotein protein IMP4 n=1 Tax=Enterospora canceri TaxID=1081671 RepID=A0A1Y1S7V4_9MICR|nr:IMP4 [Enterospora canceri]